MKPYWKSIAQAGMLALSVTALVVATQSETGKEVHHVASDSSKQEAITFDSYTIDKHLELLTIEQKTLAMNNKKEDKQEEKRVEMPERKLSNAQMKVEIDKEEELLEKKAIIAKASESTPAPVQKTQAIPQPKATPKPQPKPTPKSTPTPQPAPKQQESQNESFYIKSLPMPYEHQKYLYEMTKKRGLDYKETLAFIGHESEFNPNAQGANNYGYFQISSVNHSSLASKLGTKVTPFDPYVNINWGTYMISELYKKYGNKDAVLSAYNKGEGGYAKTGKATAYIQKHNQVLNKIQGMS